MEKISENVYAFMYILNMEAQNIYTCFQVNFSFSAYFYPPLLIKTSNCVILTELNITKPPRQMDADRLLPILSKLKK